MVITESHDKNIGPVIWVWSDDIARFTDRNDNRWFMAEKGLVKVRDVEVPLSVHDSEGKTLGLMMPKVLAHLNGIHATA